MEPVDDLDGRSTAWTEVPAGARAAGRVLHVLRLLATTGGATEYGAGLGDVVRAGGLAKPTVHRLLATLVATGFAEQDPRTARYRLGAEAQLVGALASRRTGLARIAPPLLAEVALRTRETVLLTVRREHECRCLHREDGLGEIRTYVITVGDTHPMGVDAGGLALLAAQDDAQVAASREHNAAWIAADYRRRGSGGTACRWPGPEPRAWTSPRRSGGGGADGGQVDPLVLTARSMLVVTDDGPWRP